MGKKRRLHGQRRAAKVKARQQRLTREVAVREAHARLVTERTGDPRFVQRTTGPDGVTSLHWDPDTPAGRHMAQVLEGQHEGFRQKFGREMRGDDPVFFDPDADRPMPMTPEAMDASFRRMFDDLIEQADEIGVDPAFLRASRDLGFMVTTENQHLFSAADIQAWQDTVEFYQEEDDEFDDEFDVDDLFNLLAEELEEVVAATIQERSPVPARLLTARVMQTDIDVTTEAQLSDHADEGEGEGAPGTSVAFAVLAGWLSSAREQHAADSRMADRVLAWIDHNVGTEYAQIAVKATRIIGGEAHGGTTVQELADTLETDFLPALIWLTAGVVAEYEDSDVSRLTPDDPDGDDMTPG
jgi:hypothetical protein